MQDKIELFEGKSFMHEALVYQVERVKVVSGNLMIKTDRKMFVKYPGEVDVFLNNIRFVEPVTKPFEKVKKNFVKVSISENRKMPLESVVAVEIRKANDLASDMTSKLKAMFDVLADEPSDSAYKKAQAMVNTSNAIINVQMANYKYLLLKDR
jgi:hypothetical protein